MTPSPAPLASDASGTPQTNDLSHARRLVVYEAAGGSGDPSPVTAYGVLHAMRAAALELDGSGDALGPTVMVGADDPSAEPVGDSEVDGLSEPKSDASADGSGLWCCLGGLSRNASVEPTSRAAS